MSAFRWAFNGVATKLSWLSPFQETGLFPQARVLDDTGAVVATVNLSANGTIAYFYEGSWTPSSDGEYRAVYDIYTDSGRTVKSEAISGIDEYIRVKHLNNEPFGGFGGTADIDDEAIKRISEVVVKKIWDAKLSNGFTADATLVSRSEFDPKSDDVKTKEKPITTKDVEGVVKREVGLISFSGIENTLDGMRTAMQERLQEQSGCLLETKRGLVGLQDSLGSLIHVCSEISEKNDDGRLEEIRDSIQSIQDGVRVFSESVTDNLNTLYRGMADGEILAAIKTLSSELKKIDVEKLQSIEVSLVKLENELSASEEMMNTMDKREAERMKVVIGALQKIALSLKGEIGSVNLKNVLSGFRTLGDKIEYLGI